MFIKLKRFLQIATRVCALATFEQLHRIRAAIAEAIIGLRVGLTSERETKQQQ